MGYRVKPFTMAVRDNSTQEFIDVGLLGSDVDREIEDLQLKTAGDPINVLSLGVKNDGSEDISSIINEATVSHSLYFPAGTYRVEHPLRLLNSIFGAQCDTLRPHGTIFHSTIGQETKCIIPEFDEQDAVIEASPNLSKSIEIRNITIEFDDTESGYELGLKLKNVQRGNTFLIDGVNIFNPHFVAGYLEGVSGNSRMARIKNTTIWGYAPHFEDSRGWFFGANTEDSWITDSLIAGVKVGFYLTSPLYIMNNLHIFTASTDGQAISSDLLTGTVGIRFYGTNVQLIASNIYIDGSYTALSANNGGIARITNFEYIIASSVNYTRNEATLFNAGINAKLYIDNGVAITNDKAIGINNDATKTLKNMVFMFDTPDDFSETTYKCRKHLSTGDSYEYAGDGSTQQWCKRLALGRIYFGGISLVVTSSRGRCAIVNIARTTGDITINKVTLCSTFTIYYKMVSANFIEIWADVGAGDSFKVSALNVCGGAMFFDFENNRSRSNAVVPLVTTNTASGLTEVLEKS